MTTRLGQMLLAYEQKNDLAAQDVAEEIGIGKSSYSRVKTGKQVDATGLAKIITWMVAGRDGGPHD